MHKIQILVLSTVLFLACENKPHVTEDNNSKSEAKVLSISEMNSDELLTYAKSESESGHIEEAMKAINKRLSTNQDAETYLLKANIHFQKGEFDSANNSYIQARKQDENNTESLLKLAKIQQYLGNFDNSITYLDSALIIQKTLPEAYFLKGLTFELRQEKEDAELAISSYQTATELNPNYYDAFMRLGDIYAKQKNDLAIEYYKSAINSNSNRVDSYYNLGIYYQENEKFTEAMETYDQMLAADANSFLALHNQGYILLVYSEEYEEAIEKFSDCISINSQYLEAFHNRGLAYKYLGKYEESRADFQEALIINPDSELSAKELSELDNL